MLNSKIVRTAIGISLVVWLVFIAQFVASLRPISDEFADETVLRTSRLLNAQYQEIRRYFPVETAEIRAEAKRLERMRRRGNGVPAGTMIHFTNAVMTPKYRAMHNASEEMLDISLAKVFQSYSVLKDSPNCGAFLLNGTVSITYEERQLLWAAQARNVPHHFEAIRQALANPVPHAPATRESWGQFYALHLQNGNPQSHIDTFLQAFGKEPNHALVDRDEICVAFLGLGQALVGARFPGSAALKSGLIIPSFGIAAREG